jgi:hypothetical protein
MLHRSSISITRWNSAIRNSPLIWRIQTGISGCRNYIISISKTPTLQITENKTMLRERKIFTAGLLAGAAHMTPIERQHGRFMRAPDHPAGGDEGFEGSGAWATGDDKGGADEGDKGAANVVDKADAGEADDAAASDGDEDEGDDQGGADEGEGGEEDAAEKREKPKKKASERIRELNSRLRESERERDRERGAFEERLRRLENGGQGSTNGSGADNQNAPVKPDSNDLTKYPLGSLDDRYIDDMIEYAADKKASEKIDGLLQRQEQSAQQTAAEQALSDLRAKADNIAVKGADLRDDYEEVVVKAGLRGDYKLTQVTFEAAAEAEHGAEILYDLAADKQEAARVASLSPYQQLKYVADKNAEIAGKAPPPARKIPGRDQAPPQNQPRGGNSRTEIRGDTDDLDAFEKSFYSKKK